MDPDDELDDNEPAGGWLHPDDRLWRHPSEVAGTGWPSALDGSAAVGATPGEPAAAVPGGAVATAGRPGRRWHRTPLWTVAVLSGVIGALLATGGLALGGGLGRHSTVVRPLEQLVMPDMTAATIVPASADAVVVGIAERLRPAIVQLEVDGDKGHDTGSGVVFRDDGQILTNNHVVDGATKITVVMADGHTLRGTVVGGDPETDLAVVKVDLPNPSTRLTVAPLGSAVDLKAGQTAIAIGSPLGLSGGPSVTTGVVSALGRQIDAKSGPALLDMIQTDAPIAPGSSGGALVDWNGSVIGITTAVAVGDVGAAGMGFAIPIDLARETADQLIQTGRVVHVWIGVEGEDIDSTTAAELAIGGGALVRSVRGGSPAATAGLKERDVISAVDGHTVTSMGGLVVALRTRKPGEKVDLVYWRDGKEHICTVTLAARPKNL